MDTSRNLRSNRQKGLPGIPFQYHEAYDDRYRTAGRDTFVTNDTNDEYAENELSQISSIPEGDTFINGDEHSDNYEYEESNPVSSLNDNRPPSPPPSPPKNEFNFDNETSKTLPIIPTNNTEKPLPQFDYQSQQKRKNYFNLGKTLTSRFKFKKPNAKDNQGRSVSDPIPNTEKSQSLLSSLPTLAPSSPISHQLPAEYFPDNFDKDETKSVEQTEQELTMDDLYHFVLNVQKGFQFQFNEMNSQIKELKKEIRRLKGEESEDEEPNEKIQEDLVSISVTNVRSTTRQMERHGGAGRWFHNDGDFI